MLFRTVNRSSVRLLQVHLEASHSLNDLAQLLLLNKMLHGLDGEELFVFVAVHTYRRACILFRDPRRLRGRVQLGHRRQRGHARDEAGRGAGLVLPCTARCFHGGLDAHLRRLIVNGLIVTLARNRLQRSPMGQIIIVIILVNVHLTCEMPGAVGGNLGNLELLVQNLHLIFVDNVSLAR